MFAVRERRAKEVGGTNPRGLCESVRDVACEFGERAVGMDHKPVGGFEVSAHYYISILDSHPSMIAEVLGSAEVESDPCLVVG